MTRQMAIAVLVGDGRCESGHREGESRVQRSDSRLIDIIGGGLLLIGAAMILLLETLTITAIPSTKEA